MTNEKQIKPELLAPAGDMTMLTTAVNHGADAVYFGIDKLNMRAKAKNFTVEQLGDIVKLCRENGVDTHLTLNSVVYEEELGDTDLAVRAAKDAGIDLVICWDAAVIQKCVEYEMPFCISTQASVSNTASAKFYKGLGAKRIVLARECTLEKIKEIKRNVDIEIETFVHGAMCIAVSGRCFMSHYAFGKSANRGECIQPCRREYEIYDPQSEYSLLMGEDYVLSPKDLCSIEFIDRLIEAGIDSFKIEGRKRSPEYLAKVVSTYRKAIDMYYEGTLTQEVKKEMFGELQTVYNRGFSTGFYFDTPAADEYVSRYGSVATTRKKYAGKVLNYYKKSGIAHVKLEAEDASVGDELYIIGETTGVVEHTLTGMMRDDEKVESAKKGDEITFPVEKAIRPRDKVYKIVPAK